METWLLLALTLALCATLSFLLTAKPNKKRLPPGPLAVPILGSLPWLRRSITNIEPFLRELHARYGPIVTLRIGTRTSIFVSDRRLAHKALVEQGAALASRPPALPANRFLSNNRYVINSAPYGSHWRHLRRALAAETLHPARVKLFAPARNWVLGVLTGKLRAQAHDEKPGAAVLDSFQFAMFCLLVLMCFGEKLDQEAIRAIEKAQRDLFLSISKFNVFSFLPEITKRLYRKRWNTVLEIRRRQKDLYLPLIRAREERKAKKGEDLSGKEGQFEHSYVDSLLDVRLPEEGGRALTEDEMVGLCSEFLNAGTDTTFTALQWIMAELVRNPEVQARLRHEIEQVVGKEEEMREENLHRMPYLKAVVLEGLRRHPPLHFLLPHAAAAEEGAELEGYRIPRRAAVNFLVAEMGRDGEVWAEPMEFRPERFLSGGEGEDVDLTGSREIRMMPFGTGRRICPGLGLALLHLEYLVANLVREFEWLPANEGEDVDLTEKLEFTVVMKSPLKARVVPRRKN